jgi:tetraacyldisaccharide 4'-kinase
VIAGPGPVRRARLARAWRDGRLGPLGLALTPAAWAYRLGLAARQAAYARGLLPGGRLACAVVSVGNLTVGGTGKTPAVELVARWLIAEGHRVAVVSRGHGRKPGAPVELVSDGGAPRLSAERAGDEPLLLARRLPGVAVVVGADRLAAGRWAAAHLRPDVVLLDDGFQQRRLVKDVEIVCLDAPAPWGSGRLLPRGTLREPPAALARAHLVLLSRARGLDRNALVAEVRRRAGPVPCLAVDYAVEALEDLGSGALRPATELDGRAVVAFAGIAAPERLAATLAAHGAVVRDLVAFPDHHAYGVRDLEAVARRARAVGAGLLVTTEKDAVRLERPGLPGAARRPAEAGQDAGASPAPGTWPPVLALRVRLEALAGADEWRVELRARVDAAAGRARRERRP